MERYDKAQHVQETGHETKLNLISTAKGKK